MGFIEDLLEYTQWEEMVSDDGDRRMFSRERYSTKGRYHIDRFDLFKNRPKQNNEVGFVCYQQTRDEDKIRKVYEQKVLLPYDSDFEDELQQVLLDFKRRAQKYEWL